MASSVGHSCAGAANSGVVPGETSNRLLPSSLAASDRLASVMCCCSSFVLNVEQAVAGLGLLVWDDVECVSDLGCLLQSLHCQQHQINKIGRQVEAIIVQHFLRHACRGMCNSLLYSTDMPKPCNMLIALTNGYPNCKMLYPAVLRVLIVVFLVWAKLMEDLASLDSRSSGPSHEF